MQIPTDLAGPIPETPSYLQMRMRINTLIARYLAVDVLSDRLADLPSQFTQPCPRPWGPIDWRAIDPRQIIGIDPQLFINVLAGIIEIEVPIREYAQESHDYFQQLHPAMAAFVGHERNAEGAITSMGTWGKEERQHAPAFSKIYQQLTGEKLQPKPNSVIGCVPSGDPWADLHHHVHSRITTEWSAAAVYLWLMAHSTGALQAAISQPFQDEINHLAKFWGFSRWAFGDTYADQFKGSTRHLVALVNHHQHERSTDVTTTGSPAKSLPQAIELTFTFLRVMVRLRAWNRELSPSYVRHLLGPLPQQHLQKRSPKRLVAA
jgi:hypothetical protein